MTAACINDIGLLLDIFGAILLFKFGLPDSIDREGHCHIITEQVDEEEIKKENSTTSWARLDWFCLFLALFFS